MPNAGRPAAPLLHLVADPTASATWNVKSLPGGLYLIQNAETGKCLESRVAGDTHVARLATLRSDDPRQHWRLESVSEESVASAAPSKASQTKAAQKTTPAEEEEEHRLDCNSLRTGQEGILDCGYLEVVKVMDDQSCVVLPYTYDSVEADDPIHGPNINRIVTRALPPLLLRKWGDKDTVAGQKRRVSDQVFRVTGTEDVKAVNGATVRVHVLEVVATRPETVPAPPVKPSP